MTLFMVLGNNVNSPNVEETSVINSFSPCHAGSPIPVKVGMRTADPSVSKTRGPATRNTLAAING